MTVRAITSAALPDAGGVRGAIGELLAGGEVQRMAHTAEESKMAWPIPARASWFRTVDQLHQAAFDLAAKYPDLVTVEQVGTSVQGRPILMLRMTAPAARDAAGAAKPKVLVTAGTHAREIANPEFVMREFERRAAAYGTDAEVTHQLDTTELLGIVVHNPDGHVEVERGFDAIDRGDVAGSQAVWHRGNMNSPVVDPNRNYPHGWDADSSSADPASLHYRGKAPGSEPEVQAEMGVVEREQPAVYAAVHSQAEKVLVPYGDTKVPAPDDAGLRSIAGQMALRNGYEVQSSSQFTTDSGTSKDWFYSATGRPGFTVETGTVYAQDDAQFADTVRRNSPVLTYLSSIAADPWRLGAAPSVSGVELLGTKVGAKAMVVPGRDAAAGAELVRDVHAAEGSGAPLTVAADGTISGEVPGLASGADGGGSSGGRALAFVRARDAAGNWGPLSAAWSG